MTRTQLSSGQIKGVDLGSGSDDITGTLPVGNGGTGQTSLTDLALTTPKINQIKDSNGNIILGLPPTGSAANYFNVGNAAAGGNPSIAAVGAGSDITIVWVPKGGGKFIIYEDSGQTEATIGAEGSATNVDLNLTAQNAGVVKADGVEVVTTTGTQDVTGKRATLAAGSTTVAPLKLTSGTNLTTAAAGAVEYDGVTFSGTIDTTSGRALNAMDQMFRLSADGSALGPTIADYFGTNSAFPYVAGGVYEIVWYLMYTKVTGAVVTYTITSTTAPVNLNAWYTQSAIAGIGTQAAAITAGIAKSTSTAAALPNTGTQAAASHVVEVHAIYEAHASSAGNVRLRVTSASGTVTPLRGSFYRVRRLPAGNVGTFVA